MTTSICSSSALVAARGRRARPRGGGRPSSHSWRTSVVASADIGARMLAALCRSAAAVGPERVELGDDPLAELVARARERERRVRVQALERARAAGAADAELERRAAVAARLAAASARRIARCSSSARARLAASAGSSAAARVQRSTPPAASSREIAATRWRHVT